MEKLRSQTGKERIHRLMPAGGLSSHGRRDSRRAGLHRSLLTVAIQLGIEPRRGLSYWDHGGRAFPGEAHAGEETQSLPENAHAMEAERKGEIA